MNDSKQQEDTPPSRNVGCCGLAAATWGRQHFPVCVNGRGVEWTVQS
jgi:hypothetical protein